MHNHDLWCWSLKDLGYFDVSHRVTEWYQTLSVLVSITDVSMQDIIDIKYKANDKFDKGCNVVRIITKTITAIDWYFWL